ncbi:MAG: FIVAR domain-containing protein, partial [Bifidobacteriaceae bacterium]|nr:FIVAR domain-containing protein [Bifidobacteriaceae bacterium]
MSRPTRLRRMFAAVVAAVAAVCVLVAFGAAPADAKEPTDAESGGAPKAPMAASLSQVSELDALSGAVACAQTLGLEALAYTPESWNAYTTALVAAKALILGGADATTKAAAEEALGDLLDAIAGLRARPSRTSLDAILAAALSVGIDATAYTPQSWVAWRTALDEARATAADPNATQSAIDAASANILSAGGGLRYRVTTGALDGALRLVAALGLTSGDYTPTSWAVFAAARAQASAALADPDVTAPAAAGAVAALDAALAGLTPVVSTSALEDLIGATAGFVSEDYTPDSWATLLAAIASARDTVAAPASSGAVDQAIGRLRVGIAGLTPVVSKAALHAALALIDAMNLESADYTPASWRPYIEALTRARETLASSS